MATHLVIGDPHCTPKANNDKDLSINSIAEFDDEDNVIDFLEFLKHKRDKELN